MQSSVDNDDFVPGPAPVSAEGFVTSLTDALLASPALCWDLGRLSYGGACANLFKATVAVLGNPSYETILAVSDYRPPVISPYLLAAFLFCCLMQA